ncbi:unnamed protein product [Amoebophrya sp. A25]|nr:unnamed protein product [Amoebophrya sp. A25]|eukprot:GSA25T00016576001.1
MQPDASVILMIRHYLITSLHKLRPASSDFVWIFFVMFLIYHLIMIIHMIKGK